NDRIQLGQFFAIVKCHRSKALAVDTLVGIENIFSERRYHFVVRRLPRLHHLMRHAIGLNNGKTQFMKYFGDGGFAARDSSDQSIAQHYEVSAPRTPAAICRTSGEASRLS